MFGRKKPANYTMVYVAKLNARLQPMHREVFEDPLHDQLEERGIGEVTGGGTMLDSDGRIQWCDLEISAIDDSDATRDAITAILNDLGAPKGSALTGPDDVARPLGTAEGLALHLNGTDLPAETYASSDINELITSALAALGAGGTLLSWEEGATESSLFFYGPSYTEMKQAVEPVAAAHPLGEKSRIEQIA